MLAVRNCDDKARSAAERARLGIPEGHHRIFGVDVPDAIWFDVRTDAYTFRYGTNPANRHSLEEARTYIREILADKELQAVPIQKKKRAVAYVRTDLPPDPPAAPRLPVASGGFIRAPTAEELMTGRFKRR